MKDKNQRVPPYNEEAERAVLGAMLLESERIIPLALSSYQLEPCMFYIQAHRVIFETMVDVLTRAKKPATIITVADALKTNEKLSQVGGDGYLEELLDSCQLAAHAEHYLDIVRQKWILRTVIEKARQVEQDAYQAERGDSLLKAAANGFTDIMTDEPGRRTNKEIMLENIDRWRRAADGEFTFGLSLPPQWQRLNRLVCGLENGITILGGFPSQGKTTLANEITLFLASEGKNIAWSLIDDEAGDILERFQSRKAGVSLPKLKFGHAGQANMQKIADATEILGDYAIQLNDRDRNIHTICSWLRFQNVRKPVDLFVLDYVQNVSTGDIRTDQVENARLTYVIQRLKAVSLELKIPFLILSQLSRATKGEKERFPKMSDLRGSGSLEQDAKKILFISKDFQMEEKNHVTATWVLVAKNKNGETGAIEFWFRRNYFRFDEANEDFDETSQEEIHEEMEMAFDGMPPGEW